MSQPTTRRCGYRIGEPLGLAARHCNKKEGTGSQPAPSTASSQKLRSLLVIGLQLAGDHATPQQRDHARGYLGEGQGDVDEVAFSL